MDLPNTMFDNVLEDDVNGDYFYTVLENIDSTLDNVAPTYVDLDDYTFLNDDPHLPFTFSPEGTTQDHGERIIVVCLVLRSRFMLLTPRMMVIYPWIMCFGVPIFQGKLSLVTYIKVWGMLLHNIISTHRI